MKHSILPGKKVDSNPVFMFHDYRKLPYPQKSIITAATRIYETEKLPFSKKTHVILCSDRTIRRLNSMFRNRNRPTDVLSFNYDENDLLGEIYISLQRAKVQAREYKVTYNNEVLRLFVHGMFHLLGFDHTTEKERKNMQVKELRYVH
jgi:probable rRNA maturation factor